MRLVLGVLLFAIACGHSTAAPARPRYEHGPGCTIYYTHQLSDSLYDISVEHFDVCPRVIYDSALVLR